MIALNLVEARSARWRAGVRAMARQFVSNQDKTFTLAACAECGESIYVADWLLNAVGWWPLCDRCDPWPLYQPDALGRMDGYWYACCLIGKDPHGNTYSGPLTATRRCELTLACALVGLLFGEVFGDSLLDGLGPPESAYNLGAPRSR